MDNYRGDGRRELEMARREKNLGRKIDLVIDGALLMMRELAHLFGNIGKGEG